MRFLTVLVVATLCVAPRAWAQALPDLGDASGGVLSARMERRIGESIAREIRYRDPSFLDDAEVSDYLNSLGHRLVALSPGARLDFEFFAIRDSAINAFALPGGFIGVHTGLLLAAESESELASVLAHEISHVTQRHIARLIGAEQQMSVPTMAALVLAVLASRSRPDLAQGAMIASQAGALQSQINYTRDFEREADRVGFALLTAAGFDVSAMPVFFEKLQRATRVFDDGTPSYLRTHQVTTERIADAQARVAQAPYRQHADLVEFQLVRAKLRAETGEARDAVTQFSTALRDRRYADETAARYGLASALLRERRFKEAAAAAMQLRSASVKSPMIESLAARTSQAAGDASRAFEILRAARERYPHSRPLAYAWLEALQAAGRTQEALAAVGEQLRAWPRDARLYAFQAKTYSTLGKRALQHQSQAEFYALQGVLPAAIEQLQLAQAAGDGSFYELSSVDARLKVLREEHAREMRDAKK
ncbi:MAG: M48 family metallopeptidase [Betaproteobacteria bacterium]|nr:M48 family metallopeptidase [Betaproteobacteria bacterium]